MNVFTKHVVSLVVASTLIAPAIAFAADAHGPQGTVASLEVNTQAADGYLQHHGRVIVVSGSKKGATSAEYRWGGTACGSRTLTEAQVAMLQRALESGTPITPRYQDGQGQTLCLVGFTLSP